MDASRLRSSCIVTLRGQRWTGGSLSEGNNNNNNNIPSVIMGFREGGRVYVDLTHILCKVEKLFPIGPRLKKNIFKNRFDKYKSKARVKILKKEKY